MSQDNKKSNGESKHMSISDDSHSHSNDDGTDEFNPDAEYTINCGEDLFMELCTAWLEQHGSAILEAVLNRPKRATPKNSAAKDAVNNNGYPRFNKK